jgi:hypothetical protein
MAKVAVSVLAGTAASMGGKSFCGDGRLVCGEFESWASLRRPGPNIPSIAIIKNIQRVFMMFLHLRSDTSLEYNHAQPVCHRVVLAKPHQNEKALIRFEFLDAT